MHDNVCMRSCAIYVCAKPLHVCVNAFAWTDVEEYQSLSCELHSVN